MKCSLVLATLVASALAAPGPVPAPQNRGYSVRAPKNAVSLHGQAKNQQRGFTIRLKHDSIEDTGVPTLYSTPNQNAVLAKHVDSVESRESLESLEINAPCPKGQLRHGFRCVVPKVNRNIFVFGRAEDDNDAKSIDHASLPPPEIDYNIIFVKPSAARKPVVVPPPQKKTVVYVLEDEKSPSDEILETPSYPDIDPEVYYVKVKPGENPQLPGGLDLHTAYNQALQDQDSDDLEDAIEHSLGTQLAAAAAAQGQGAGGAGVGGVQGVGGAGAGAFPVSLEEIAEQVAHAGGAGVPLPPLGSAAGGATAPAPSFNLANLNDVGVPLPSFQGAKQSSQGHQSQQGDQGLAANLANSQALIRLMRQSLAAQGLELDIDNGIATVDALSAEAVNPARRYLLP